MERNSARTSSKLFENKLTNNGKVIAFKERTSYTNNRSCKLTALTCFFWNDRTRLTIFIHMTA